MSSRRSGRAKAPVKYTSDSENSDFGDKKRKTKATSKKRTKAEAEPAADTPKKRAKKDPETLAAEHKEKAAVQESKAEKAAHKKAWEAWLEENDASGALLDEEPGKDVSITQTDAGKKYGVKKEDLVALKHFEKRNPVYNNTIKLYLEDDIKELGFRKYGILNGAKGDEAVAKGEEIWKEEYVLPRTSLTQSSALSFNANTITDTKTTRQRTRNPPDRRRKTRKKPTNQPKPKPPNRNGQPGPTQTSDPITTISPTNQTRALTNPTVKPNTACSPRSWRC